MTFGKVISASFKNLHKAKVTSSIPNRQFLGGDSCRLYNYPI